MNGLNSVDFEYISSCCRQVHSRSINALMSYWKEFKISDARPSASAGE